MSLPDQRISGADKVDRINSAETTLSNFGDTVKKLFHNYEQRPEVFGKLLETLAVWHESGLNESQIRTMMLLFSILECEIGEKSVRKNEVNYHTQNPEPTANHMLGVNNHSLGSFRDYELGHAGVSPIEKERFEILEKGLAGVDTKFFLSLLSLLHDSVEDGLLKLEEVPQILNDCGLKDPQAIKLLRRGTDILTKPDKPNNYQAQNSIAERYYKTYCKIIADPEPRLKDLPKEEVIFVRAAIQWVKLNGDMAQNLISPQSQNQIWKFTHYYYPLIKALNPSFVDRLSPRSLDQIQAHSPHFLELESSHNHAVVEALIAVRVQQLTDAPPESAE